MLNTLIFLFATAFISTITSNPTPLLSTTLPPDIIFGLTLSLTFTDPHTLINITATDAHKIKNILYDIITDQIESIFDTNTITNCIEYRNDLITLQTTATAHVMLRAIITACNEEVEDQLLLIYDTNSTLPDEFMDTLQSETALTLIGDLRMDIDTISAYDITTILSTNTYDDRDEGDINKIWLLNTVYIGTAFIATCIVFVILFMYCIHRKKEIKAMKESVTNTRKDMELGANVPGLSRMRSLSSSPGSPEVPPLSSADQFGMNQTVSQHYLVYGTEDITTLTPSPYPVHMIKGHDEVDFVERAITINKRILKPLPKKQRASGQETEAVEVHIPRIKFEDLDVDDDDAADPELSYSP